MPLKPVAVCQRNNEASIYSCANNIGAFSIGWKTHLSLSTFIRRAIHNVKIEKTVIVAGGGEETLTSVSTLLAQCSKVGTNLNQLTRHFNSGGADTAQIRAKLLDELADLTAFRLNAEKVLGELYGNAQAYRL